MTDDVYVCTIGTLDYGPAFTARLAARGLDPDKEYPVDVIKRTAHEEIVDQLRAHGIRVERRDGLDVFDAEGVTYELTGDGGFVQTPYEGPGNAWDDPDDPYVDVVRRPEAYERVAASRTRLTDELWAVRLNDEVKRKRDAACRRWLT